MSTCIFHVTRVRRIYLIDRDNIHICVLTSVFDGSSASINNLTVAMEMKPSTFPSLNYD